MTYFFPQRLTSRHRYVKIPMMTDYNELIERLEVNYRAYKLESFNEAAQALRELQKYARHSPSCQTSIEGITHCDCGFERVQTSQWPESAVETGIPELVDDIDEMTEKMASGEPLRPAEQERDSVCVYTGNECYCRDANGFCANMCPQLAKPERELTGCAAGKDGECTDPMCPQNRDGEPMATGRSCPLPGWGDDPEY